MEHDFLTLLIWLAGEDLISGWVIRPGAVKLLEVHPPAEVGGYVELGPFMI